MLIFGKRRQEDTACSRAEWADVSWRAGEPNPWSVSAQLSLLKVTVCASWTDPCSEVQRTQKSRFCRGRRTVSRMLGLLEHNQHARELISARRRHVSTTTKT